MKQRSFSELSKISTHTDTDTDTGYNIEILENRYICEAGVGGLLAI